MNLKLTFLPVYKANTSTKYFEFKFKIFDFWILLSTVQQSKDQRMSSNSE